MDRNLLHNRISLLKEWGQVESLNEILFSVLSSLNTYTQDRFDKLTQEIRDESRLNNVAPITRIAVCTEENTEEQVYLHPVSTSPPINCPDYITTVFVECDYLTVQEIMRRTYTAEIANEAGTFKTEVCLRYSQKYLQRLEWLYHTFSENELSWATVNGIYFYKFLDIYCTQNVGHEAKFFSIDFAEHEKYISYDKVLLWNAHQLTVPVSAREAKPAYNAVLYEHTLKKLQTDGSRYLVCPMGDRFSSFWSGSEMRVRTQTRQLEQIDIMRITGGEDIGSPLYLQPKSNRKKECWAEALARGRYIPTRGEAERIVHSLSDETDLRLVDVKVIPSTEENLRQYSGLDYNFFIETNSFLRNKKLLLFTFEANISPMWMHETMFFVLSELQLYFYEYHCVGELI